MNPFQIQVPTLLLTSRLDSNPRGGRQLLCRLNHDMLRVLCGSRLTVHEIDNDGLHGLRGHVNALRGHIDGVNPGLLEDVLARVRDLGIRKVFIDGSNLGELARAIKGRLPTVEITTFFHNVESRFFWGAFRNSRRPRALAVALANFVAERKAVRHSDKIVCMSERDSALLHRVYGRSATHVSPMALRDRMPEGFAHDSPPVADAFALFVGGTFYANQAGIAWFAREVAPRVRTRVCVVGMGFEAHREALAVPGKVEVIGAVDDLSTWYRDARFVIAPIFDGSGMKTKVAEALMYGKKIIGTEEAFTGYEEIAGLAGWRCHSADEFVHAFGEAERIDRSFDPALRQAYVDHYSLPAATARLAQILADETHVPR